MESIASGQRAHIAHRLAGSASDHDRGEISLLPGAMTKFIVVGYRRSDLTPEQFRRYFREIHGPLAAAIPGLRRYVQNFVEPDERRHPPWDIVVEFWFDDREAMECAWRSNEGRRATEDNANCLDLERTRWSVVDEIVVLG